MSPSALKYCDVEHPLFRDPISMLQQVLRPAGGGVYVVSTGVEQQRSLQRAIYGVEETSDLEGQIERAWLDALHQALGAHDEARGASLDPKILLLGVPSDTGAGFTRGANLAPAELRTHLLKHHPEHLLLSEATIDVGDVRVIPQLLSEEMLSEAQRRESARALFGDSSRDVALPVTPLDITALALTALTSGEASITSGRAVTPIVIGGITASVGQRSSPPSSVGSVEEIIDSGSCTLTRTPICSASASGCATASRRGRGTRISCSAPMVA